MTVTELFFGSWEGILHALIIGGLAYLGFIALLLFGKAMLMEASPSSLVMTASLGSGLAAIVLVQSIGIFEGLVGFFIIMLVQTVFVHLSKISERAKSFLREQPTILYFEGHLLEAVMRQHGVTQADVFTTSDAQACVRPMMLVRSSLRVTAHLAPSRDPKAEPTQRSRVLSIFPSRALSGSLLGSGVTCDSRKVCGQGGSRDCRDLYRDRDRHP